MKKSLLSILAVFLLTAGAAMAQSANTTAPGPTQQREPGQTSNNLPNPGNPQTDLSNRDTYTQGTTGTTGTTTGTTTTTTTGTGTGLTGNETEQNEGMDVDVDTGARANGAVDVDVKTHGDNDTDASGIDETGTGAATETGTTTGTTETGALPDTASELPLLAIAGLLALASFFMVRMARRNVA